MNSIVLGFILSSMQKLGIDLVEMQSKEGSSMGAVYTVSWDLEKVKHQSVYRELTQLKGHGEQDGSVNMSC